MNRPNNLSHFIGDVFLFILLYISYFFLTAFSLFALCMIIAKGPDNVPDVVGSILVVFSLIVSVWFAYRSIKKRRNARFEEYDKAEQNEQAQKILANIEVCVNLANETDDVTLFVKWYDEALDGFKQLMEFDKVKFTDPPSHDYYRIRDEFQWHLCDAIMRSKEHTISEITGKYKYSKERKIRVADSFTSDIEEIKSRFSADTAELADEAVRDIRRAAGLTATEGNAQSQYVPNDDFIKYGNIESALLNIDLMEGHDFEYWCADLLRKIGFSHVEVTKGSGDQGVDILAQKDSVSYAIQCKCYNKDLGNGPIQEVNTGRVIYRCHVGAVMTNRYFTSGAKEAAAATGVLLWDRDWISKQLTQQ